MTTGNVPAHPGGRSAVVDCALYEEGRRCPGVLVLEEAGDRARDTDGFVWIGLHEPSAADIADVAAEFGLPPLAVEDAVKAHQRPKLEVYGDVVFAVLKPVEYHDHGGAIEVSELALFLGDGFVVTVRHGPSTVLRRVRERIDDGDQRLRHGPVSVLYRTVDLVVDEYEAAIEALGADVDDIEALVFGVDESNHAEPIYQLKRVVAQLRRAVLPLAGPLHRLSEGQVPDIPEATVHYFRDVYDHLLRAGDAMEAHDRMLSDVLQADVARVSVRQAEISLRQNEDMRKISAWAAIALLPTAVAGVYGMNFDHMPELRWQYSYYVVLALIAGGCYSLYRLFRTRGWL